MPVRGAVGLGERGLYDDKLICSRHSVSTRARRAVTGFFCIYVMGKRVLNVLRGLPTDGHCTGWGDGAEALARSRPRDPGWHGPPVPF